MTEKRRRYIGDYLELESNGVQNFEGKIVYRGPFEFCEETTFSIFAREDSDGGPKEIFFGIKINIPQKSKFYHVELQEPFIPRRHLKSEPWMPVSEASDSDGKPRGRNELMAHMINLAIDAKLTITSDEEDSEIEFNLIFENFDSTGCVDKSDIPEAEELLNRCLPAQAYQKTRDWD
jgi:hypothetical protein